MNKNLKKFLIFKEMYSMSMYRVRYCTLIGERTQINSRSRIDWPPKSRLTGRVQQTTSRVRLVIARRVINHDVIVTLTLFRLVRHPVPVAYRFTAPRPSPAPRRIAVRHSLIVRRALGRQFAAVDTRAGRPEHELFESSFYKKTIKLL